ncbi:restriction endonuclease subunit S [Kosakonia sp. R1.Fl]|uniref:restriction endonuclease subunit S n=1 Tax=Kosakonia sp. R1.Fl TaxID=2928706 RepID=UPI00201DD68B|nr:restriction endonuclease subunit S [Kosakonia sp. R1.Fl]MCL6746961.1 restriction endonuclease subunit S [Kosakonia sp. R1.Fl]
MTVEKLITDHIDIWSSSLQTRSTAGRGSNGKIDLYGIKKLRELILELAVRGKLVPQDPNDEPASELLKRIAAEKVELVKQGKIKKQKPLPEISEDEKPFGLPAGWEWVRLIDIMADIHYGYTASADETKEVKLLRITDIQDDKVNWGTVPGCDISEKMVEQYKLNNNDIVIARTGGTVGKSYLVENINVSSVFASYLIRLKYLSPMKAGFTKVFLGSQLYWKQLYDGTSGTGQPNVNGNTLKAIILPIAPINEQHKVISKVDELMSLCDQLEQQSLTSLDAHQQLVETLLSTLTDSQNAEELAENWARINQHFDTLFTTEASIDALKQTILQLAVMGKLVPQDPNDEPASELLKRIEQEKSRLVASSNLKTSASYVINSNDAYLNIPESWGWIRLGNIAKFIDYRGKTPNKINTGVRLITAKNIRNGYIDLQPEEFISENDYVEWMTRGFPKKGDLLFTTEAPLGNAAIIDIEDKFALAQRAICLQWHIEQISPFMLLQFMSSPFQNQLVANATGMTALGIKASKLKEIPVVVPPLDEQYLIVKTVKELFTFCDHLKSRLQSAQQTQLNLADALTDAALN